PRGRHGRRALLHERRRDRGHRPRHRPRREDPRRPAERRRRRRRKPPAVTVRGKPMLEEFKSVAQQPETPGYRRWFSDAVMELIVWYSPGGEVRGFQLCYDRDGRERAFTWHVDAGMAHTAVDDGEESPWRND